MKRALDLLGLLAFLIVVFWPWALIIVEACRWFFVLPPLLHWDVNRALFAILWPAPAFFLVAVLLCLWEL